MKIRKGDTVAVIRGASRGTVDNPTLGKVIKVLAQDHKVVVEGVNRVYRHLKPSRQNPQGGRLQKEMPIHVANVQIYCASCRRPVRIGYRIEQDGSKYRYCKKCDKQLDSRPINRRRTAETKTS